MTPKKFNIRELKGLEPGYYWASSFKLTPPIGIVKISVGSTPDYTRITFPYPNDCTRMNARWEELYPDLLLYGPLKAPNLQPLP